MFFFSFISFFLSFVSPQECQNLLEENRRLVNRNGSSEIMNGQDTLMPIANGSVEEAVLQTQIETLQWQLTQVTN